jgi:hypothetical protein
VRKLRNLPVSLDTFSVEYFKEPQHFQPEPLTILYTPISLSGLFLIHLREVRYDRVFCLAKSEPFTKFTFLCWQSNWNFEVKCVLSGGKEKQILFKTEPCCVVNVNGKMEVTVLVPLQESLVPNKLAAVQFMFRGIDNEAEVVSYPSFPQILPIIGYISKKGSKALCEAALIWLGNSNCMQDKLTWKELCNRFGHYMLKFGQPGMPVRKQSLKYLAKKISPEQPLVDSTVITYSQYRKCQVGEWLYRAVKVIKKRPMVWQHNSLQVFLDHDDAVAVLNYYCCQPGDFVFRISSESVTQGTGLRLVCTYLDQDWRFQKKDMSGHEEEIDFVKNNTQLQRVLRLEALSNRPVFVPKAECKFNISQFLGLDLLQPKPPAKVDYQPYNCKQT